MNSYGNLLKSKCKFDEAIEKFEQSASIYRRCCGAESIEYAATVMNLANVLDDSAHFETALAYYDVALNIKQRLFGVDHEECSNVLCNIGGTLYRLNRLDEARRRIEQAMQIYERVYGTAAQHVALCSGLTTLGNIACAQRQFVNALQYFERAWCIRRRANFAGDDQVGVANVLNDIGNVFVQQARFDDALAMYEESLSIYLRLFGGGDGGENHLRIARTLRNIGELLLKMQMQQQQHCASLDRAVLCFERSLSIYEKVNYFFVLFVCLFVIFFSYRCLIWKKIMKIEFER